MIKANQARHMLKNLRHLLQCSRGAAALEAAIILPIFVMFLLGAVEMYQQFRAQSQVDLVANNIANSLAMQQRVFSEPGSTAANAVQVYGPIAEDLFRPLSFSDGRVRLAVLNAEPQAGSPSTITWQVGDGWPVIQGNAAVTHSRFGSVAGLPEPQVGASVVIVEALYKHTPFVLSADFWSALTGERTMYSRAVVNPRFGDVGTVYQPED